MVAIISEDVIEVEYYFCAIFSGGNRYRCTRGLGAPRAGVDLYVFCKFFESNLSTVPVAKTNCSALVETISLSQKRSCEAACKGSRIYVGVGAARSTKRDKSPSRTV
jgi:hypothetical protein